MLLSAGAAGCSADFSLLASASQSVRPDERSIVVDTEATK